jgi:hypothetical protein
LFLPEQSRSVNKSFGIFTAATLRHCSTNIAHDVEGYKSLIARPYESVNRAMPGSYYSDVERTIFLTYVILREDIAKYDELFQQERKFISYEYWSAHGLAAMDYDELVYGQLRLSDIAAAHPAESAMADGLTRFLYEIILRRMEIRDKSRSVNAIDVIFNFDAIGFTGTPFIDNYPTFAYIREGREGAIPDLIDRSFYAYSSDALAQDDFEARFGAFQGQNSRVLAEYVPSDEGIVTAGGGPAGAAGVNATSQRPRTAGAAAAGKTAAANELGILTRIFAREDAAAAAAAAALGGSVASSAAASPPPPAFNALVDLCGVFKRSTVHDVRDLLLKHYGGGAGGGGGDDDDRCPFHYVYHIGQSDSSDRVLAVRSDNDVQFDEEFYKHLCQTYGAALRERVFFFVDNRNTLGKDVPFQLVYQRSYGRPLFTKSAVLAHDVDDFSKIWQAMGRSRTMNDTLFSIYKSHIPPELRATAAAAAAGPADIKAHGLTRLLYVRNCDRKMAGNLSSIYQTLISLLNLSTSSFYYCDEIVNTFLESMRHQIGAKVAAHEEQLVRHVLRAPLPARILSHILSAKFGRSAAPAVRDAAADLTPEVVEALLRNVVQQKFEQRQPSGDVHDDFIRQLSGEQQSLMEISYTKQQQKQKQKQQNKNQDADTMAIFDKRHQIAIAVDTDDYFAYMQAPGASLDVPRMCLSLPLAEPIVALRYTGTDGARHALRVYPTLQFLYSHHIQPAYISAAVKESLAGYQKVKPRRWCERFLLAVTKEQQAPAAEVAAAAAAAAATEATAAAAAAAATAAAAAAEGEAAEGEAADPVEQLAVDIEHNFVRTSPLYSLLALRPGVYVIGMKDQFNTHDLAAHPLGEHAAYIADEAGFILHDRAAADGACSAASVGRFGPYGLEQYLLMEVLSRQEVATNVLDHYVRHREKLQRSLEGFDEKQGKGFVCWRFIMKE